MEYETGMQPDAALLLPFQSCLDSSHNRFFEQQKSWKIILSVLTRSCIKRPFATSNDLVICSSLLLIMVLCVLYNAAKRLGGCCVRQ